MLVVLKKQKFSALLLALFALSEIGLGAGNYVSAAAPDAAPVDASNTAGNNAIQPSTEYKDILIKLESAESVAEDKNYAMIGDYNRRGMVHLPGYLILKFSVTNKGKQTRMLNSTQLIYSQSASVALKDENGSDFPRLSIPCNNYGRATQNVANCDDSQAASIILYPDQPHIVYFNFAPVSPTSHTLIFSAPKAWILTNEDSVGNNSPAAAAMALVAAANGASSSTVPKEDLLLTIKFETGAVTAAKVAEAKPETNPATAANYSPVIPTIADPGHRKSDTAVQPNEPSLQAKLGEEFKDGDITLKVLSAEIVPGSLLREYSNSTMFFPDDDDNLVKQRLLQYTSSSESGKQVQKGSAIRILVHVRNASGKNKFDYLTLTGKLSDEIGNQYRPLHSSYDYMRGGSSISGVRPAYFPSLYPNDAVTEALYFEPPIGEAKTFSLYLSNPRSRKNDGNSDGFAYYGDTTKSSWLKVTINESAIKRAAVQITKEAAAAAR